MNEANISQCKFATAIVPYMYGELGTRDSGAFETHMLDCTSCADEFAAVSVSRYEVYEWKKLEFEPLATPTFEIPYVDSVKVSFVSRLRASWTLGWTPAVGFAALVMAIGAAWFLSGISTPSPTLTAANTSSDVVEQVAVPAPEIVANDDAEAAPANTPSSATRIKAPAATGVRPRTPVREAKRVTPRVVQPARVTTASQDRPSPRLNDFAEDEDKSLRLAELFEDVETSE